MVTWKRASNHLLACHDVERVCVTFSIILRLRESFDVPRKNLNFIHLPRVTFPIGLEFHFWLQIIFQVEIVAIDSVIDYSFV